VLKRSGLVDVQMYDLRRTLGSWLVGAGGNVREVMGILGHTTMAAAQVYMQMDIGPLERRHKLATDAMRRAIGEE
jgi:site-specific recombinase XerC